MFTLTEIQSILTDTSPETTEKLARQAEQLTRQYFGRTISIYAPIYLSNYCSSHCTYCGFHSHNKIQRIKLTPEQMHKEMQWVAQTGIENILLLTGESYKATPVSYLKKSVRIAKQYFTSISLEVHPMDTSEYKELFLEGVDGIAVYQETYNQKRYKEVHIAGKKKDYTYRFKTPERIAQSGIRQISMGILLGLTDPAEDLYTLFSHLQFMEKNYPGIEYSLSFPRLRTIKGETLAECPIDDITLTKIICLTRILFPRVGINLSTRENAYFRDNILGLGITRISAGSNTAVGGYSEKSSTEQDPQFDIEDTRSMKDILKLLKEKNFDPILTDWRPIQNDIISS